ncbi:CAP domain-containing protein [Paenibacillaceae bacterium WGS1546]|uniref:CAP domain-containing protein n=1 Tax=Cohnella sp. WGS1546 TaxID=3366810 RepID=UPI00372D7D52
MKKFNGWKKTLMMGTLALAIAVPAGAGAASAAPVAGNNAVTKAQLTQLFSQYGIDLNKLLEQIAQIQAPAASKPSTGAGNNGSESAKPSKPQPTQPSQPSKPQPTQPSQPGTGNNGGSETSTSAYASQVVDIVNQERAKAGLSPLQASNPTLTKMALDKAKDMYHNNYFDHNSPTYGSPFDMMKQYGINYRYAGENIAKGQRTPQEVMNAWMNSPGHKKNILSPNFTTIGVAYYNGVWVQAFMA